MKQLQAVKNWLIGGCVRFTALTAALLLIKLFAFLSEKQTVIHMQSFALLLLASFLFSFADWVFFKTSLPGWGRVLLHFAIVITSVFLCLVKPAVTFETGEKVLYAILLLAALYWIVFGLIALVKSRIKKIMDQK